jgi:pimeloyl-ACP methyl ester carboxylesterase
MHIDIKGSGSELVLVHGAPQGPDDVEGLAATFRQEHRVAVVHLPGYGETPPIESGYTMEAVAAELVEDLVVAGIKAPILVGISVGAYRCLQLALDPGALKPRGLFLMGPYAELEEPERDAFRSFIPALEAGADILDVATPRLLGQAWREAHPDEARIIVTGMLASIDRRGARAEFSAIADCPDLLDRTSALDLPVYLRVGEEDAATPKVHAERLHEKLPRSTLEVVRGHGHLLHHEDTEANVDALRSFIAQCG